MTYVSKNQDLESGIPGQGASRGALHNQQKSSGESGGIELNNTSDVRGYGLDRASDSSRRPLQY